MAGVTENTLVKTIGLIIGLSLLVSTGVGGIIWIIKKNQATALVPTPTAIPQATIAEKASTGPTPELIRPPAGSWRPKVDGNLLFINNAISALPAKPVGSTSTTWTIEELFRQDFAKKHGDIKQESAFFKTYIVEVDCVSVFESSLSPNSLVILISFGNEISPAIMAHPKAVERLSKIKVDRDTKFVPIKPIYFRITGTLTWKTGATFVVEDASDNLDDVNYPAT